MSDIFELMRKHSQIQIIPALGRLLILILIISVYSASLNGQSADEQIIVTFKKQIFKKSLFCSEKFLIPKPIGTPFIGLSGYIENKEFDKPIFYRTQTSGTWSDWQEFRKFHEQQPGERITFEGNPLDEKVEFIQFKTHKKIELPLTVRLFYPGHSKKKPNR